MFDSIVVGTDGSSSAGEAVRRAGEIAKMAGATLHVVTAYQSATRLTAVGAAAAGAMPLTGLETVDTSLREAAEQLVGRVASDLKDEGVTAQAHVMEGEPSDVLLDAGEAYKAGLIVVGNKGMRGTKRLLLGSVPNRIAHHAGCDVLIVHTT